MAHPLERFKKTTGDGPSATLYPEDWNGMLDTVGPLLAQLVQKGADFDAVSNTVLGVLLDRVNGVLSPAYDRVAERGAQIERLYAELTGQGVSAALVLETADRLFLTADRRAAILAELRGVVDAAHDTLGELATLVDQANAGVAANTTAITANGASIANRLRGDAAGGYSAAVIAQFLANLKLNTTGAVSFRNRLINGNFAINQRGAASASTSYAAGAYAMDRWKAGSGGCTLSFASASNGDVTATITAGTLVQVIEGGLHLPEGGAYVLSWSGSATARVYQGSATGIYAASPVVPTGLSAGTNTVVEFGTGTLTLAQFEPGTAATAFERRDGERRRARRYYRTGNFQLSGNGYTATALVSTNIFFDVEMRAGNPAMSATLLSYNNLSGINIAAMGADGALFASQAAAAGNCTGIGAYTAGSEL